MIRLVLALSLLCSCSSSFRMQHPTRPMPLAPMLVDAVLFSAGACIGLDGWAHGDQTQEALGFGLAAIVWVPMWFGPEAR
jgi:hypothetical protein